MMAWLAGMGGFVLDRLVRLGRANLFLLRLLGALRFLFQRPGLLIKQLYVVGVLSLPIILVSGLFVGMVLGLQGYANLVDFGATSSLGTVVALSLIRELGPVLTALYSRAFVALFPCLRGSIPVPSWLYSRAKRAQKGAVVALRRGTGIEPYEGGGSLALRLGKAAAGGGFGKVPLLAGTGGVATINMHEVARIYAPVRNDAKRLEVVKGCL